MTDEQWIVVPNWDKFQHYKDRRPVWIKVYTELVHKDEWRRLSNAECGLLVRIWIESALGDGQISTRSLREVCGKSFRTEHLASLNHAGFIALSDSKPLARRYHRDREVLRTSRERDVLEREPVDNGSRSHAKHRCPQPHCQLEFATKSRLAEHVHNVHEETR